MSQTKKEKAKKNPIIKVPVETYSRVVGYFRPVTQWNKGKQSEFFSRYHYSREEIERSMENALDPVQANIA